MVPGTSGLCRIRGTTHEFILDSAPLWSPISLLITFVTALSLAPPSLPDLVFFQRARRELYAANRRVPIRPRFVPDSFQFSTKLRNYGDNSPCRRRRMGRGVAEWDVASRRKPSATSLSSKQDRKPGLCFDVPGHPGKVSRSRAKNWKSRTLKITGHADCATPSRETNGKSGQAQNRRNRHP